MNFISKTVVLATAALSSVSAWKASGHLLVARIAYDKLQKDGDQSTIDKVEVILKTLQKDFPTWTVKEGEHSFVEGVTFADDIKYKGGGFQSSWHFNNEPYLDEGGSEKDFPKFHRPPHNITEAITSIKMWMNKESGYDKTFYYQQIRDHGIKGHSLEDSYSIALRLLMHYIGDAHQPLHSTARVDKEYPTGDKGGNSFPVKFHYGANELHAVWDATGYEFHVNPKQPFTSSTWDDQGAKAAKLVKDHAVSSLPSTTDLDPYHW